MSNREENEIYSYAQNDLANRMARNVIDSKSTVNLSSGTAGVGVSGGGGIGGMQHSYPGARSNFFYEFSATGRVERSSAEQASGLFHEIIIFDIVIISVSVVTFLLVPLVSCFALFCRRT